MFIIEILLPPQSTGMKSISRLEMPTQHDP